MRDGVRNKILILDVERLPGITKQYWWDDGAAAIRGHVGAMGVGWGLAIDRDFEAHRSSIGARTEHQMQVTGMEAVGDAPAGLVEGDLLAADVPLAFQGPVVQGQGADLTKFSARWAPR